MNTIANPPLTTSTGMLAPFTRPPYVLVVSGTSRPESMTLQVSRIIQSHFAKLRVSAKLLDLAQLPAHAFLPHAYQERKDPARPYAEMVLQAAGLVLVVPEYNGSFPGVLKHWIDLLPFPASFERRAVSFVGLASGQWGSLRSIEQLQMVFAYRNAFLHPQRVFVPAVEECVEGSRITKPDILQRLEDQAAGFCSFIEHLSQVPIRTDPQGNFSQQSESDAQAPATLRAG